MMTGDAYVLPIGITLAEGDVTASSFEDIEITVGGIRKTLKKRDITFDAETKDFLVSFTQEETFKLRGKREVQMRVKFANGDVQGLTIGELEHEESTSKEVL